MAKEHKERKDARGRKEHPLKILVKSNKEARDAFLDLVKNLGKMQRISASLIRNGLSYGDNVFGVDNISVPTLSAIIKENGGEMKKGRPAASGSTIWRNRPQAIQAVCQVLRDYGLHKGRNYLLNNGITYKNENGEDEHFTFSTSNGKKLLSITTLSKVARENAIAFTTGPRTERVKTLVTKKDQEIKIDNIEVKIINKHEDEELEDEELENEELEEEEEEENEDEDEDEEEYDDEDDIEEEEEYDDDEDFDDDEDLDYEEEEDEED